MTETQELIEAAYNRILTTAEQSKLIYGLWKGTPGELIASVNKAYAIAKQYDSFGGGRLHQELHYLFDKLGSSDFKVLYCAVKLAKSKLQPNEKRRSAAS